MIRRATDQDISALKTLWENCFDDSRDYIDFFYDNVAHSGDSLVFELGGRIVSMLTMIPVEFVYQDKAVRAVYIYGAATQMEYRRKGIMRSLLEKAEATAKSNGCALSILVPGEKYLFKYYKDLNYAADFNMNVIKVRHGLLDRSLVPDKEPEYDVLTAAELYEMREKALLKIPHVRWYPSQLEFILKDAALYGEHTARLTCQYGSAYAIYEMQKKTLFLKELLGDSAEAQQALALRVIEKENPGTVLIHQPQLAELFRYDGEVLMYGMAKPLSGTHNIKDMEPYMNLMLD